jgi:hypothetical protein
VVVCCFAAALALALVSSAAVAASDYSTPYGKLTGVSAGTGCHALGLVVPSGPKTVFNLDVTLSGCTYPGYNQRYSGNLFLYPKEKDSYASLRLRSYQVDTGSKSESYDVRATLKR